MVRGKLILSLHHGGSKTDSHYVWHLTFVGEPSHWPHFESKFLISFPSQLLVGRVWATGWTCRGDSYFLHAPLGGGGSFLCNVCLN